MKLKNRKKNKKMIQILFIFILLFQQQQNIYVNSLKSKFFGEVEEKMFHF